MPFNEQGSSDTIIETSQDSDFPGNGAVIAKLVVVVPDGWIAMYPGRLGDRSIETAKDCVQ